MATPELQQGTLDLLILTTLHLGPLHGWAISRRIQYQSDDVLRVGNADSYEPSGASPTKGDARNSTSSRPRESERWSVSPRRGARIPAP
jgi:hypothetical protein